MYVAIPPKMSVSEVMSYLKGKKCPECFMTEHAGRCGQNGRRHLMGGRIYVATVGNVNRKERFEINPGTRRK